MFPFIRNFEHILVLCYVECWSHTFTFSKGTSHEAASDYNKHQGRVQRRTQRHNFYSTPSPDQLCKPTNSTSRPIRWQHTRPQCDDDQASVPIAHMKNKWGNWCRWSPLTNLKKVVVCPSEMLVPTYQSIRCFISEDRNIQYVKVSRTIPHITLIRQWLDTNTTWPVEYIDSRQGSFSSSKGSDEFVLPTTVLFVSISSKISKGLPEAQ